MIQNPRRTLACFAIAGCCLGNIPQTDAQQPLVEAANASPSNVATRGPVDFRFDLGRSSQQAAGVHSVGTLKATQPRDSRLTGQKVRLIIEDTTAQGTRTRLLSLSTGKHKTVGQFCENLRDIFRKYQTSSGSASGQEIGKIGDLKYGGEVRFVAESPDHLRYDMLTEGEENHSARLSASDVSSLIALLGQTEQPSSR